MAQMTEQERQQAEDILRKEVEKHPDGYKMDTDYIGKISKDEFSKTFEAYCDALRKNPDMRNVSFTSYLKDCLDGNEYPWPEMGIESPFDGFDIDDAADDYLTAEFEYGKTSDECDLINEYLEEEDITLSKALGNFGFNGVDYDITSLLGEYHVNLILATESEKNHDMGAIPTVYDYDVKESARNFEGKIDRGCMDNSLTYLICQQGYLPSDLLERHWTPRYSESAFINSVADEIDNNPGYGMGNLTVLATVNQYNVEILDRIAKGEGCIEFPKNSMLGIYNKWQGAGSVLEIALDKPFVCPAKMVWDMQVEDSHRKYEYSVNETYGLIGSCWKAEPSVTDVDPVTEIESYENKMKEDRERIVSLAEQISHRENLPDYTNALKIYGVTALTLDETDCLPDEDVPASYPWYIQPTSQGKVSACLNCTLVEQPVVGGTSASEPTAYGVRPALLINAEANGLQPGQEFKVDDIAFKVEPVQRDGYDIALSRDVLVQSDGKVITVPYRECAVAGMGSDGMIYTDLKTGLEIMEKDINDWDKSDVRAYLENDFVNEHYITLSRERSDEEPEL